jgi:transposase
VNIPVLGIDIAKATFQACILGPDDRPRQRGFNNNATGFNQLAKWLRNSAPDLTRVCMEATGTYWRALANDLHARGFAVHVVNPKFIKHYGISVGARTKNDRADARLIAHFCLHQELPAWAPPSRALAELQGLVRRRHDLTQMRTEELNRAHESALTAAVQRSLKSNVAHLGKCVDALDTKIADALRSTPEFARNRDLLTTIPGIGPVTAAILIAEIGPIARFPSARELAAHAGIVPAEHTSGTSVRGNARICKVGSDHLRRALYMPALCLISRPGPLGDVARRIKARNTQDMVAVVAVMHKLLRVVYGVLKHEQPFNPELLAHNA